MKNIYDKINVSPFLLILIFISFISGLFKEILTFFLIIIIHELGHVLTSIILKRKIKKISFGITGGFITYDDRIDTPLSEEFLISISGVIMQTIFYLLCSIFLKRGIINDKLFFLIEKYHFSILIFNLIPVIPLDGSKIIEIFLCKVFPYKKSLYLNSFISFFTCVLMFIMMVFNYDKLESSYVMLYVFILKKSVKYFKEIPYIFNKFLFERYCYPANGITKLVVNSTDLKLMKRRKRHVFKGEKRYYTEREILKKKFD